MDTSQLAPYFTQIIQTVEGPLVEGFIFAAKFTDPAANDAAIAAKVEGQIKHYLRGEISWGVDIIWPLIEPQVGTVISKYLAADPVPTPPLAAPAVPQATGTVSTSEPLALNADGTFTPGQENQS